MRRRSSMTDRSAPITRNRTRNLSCGLRVLVQKPAICRENVDYPQHPQYPPLRVTETRHLQGQSDYPQPATSYGGHQRGCGCPPNCLPLPSWRWSE